MKKYNLFSNNPFYSITSIGFNNNFSIKFSALSLLLFKFFLEILGFVRQICLRFNGLNYKNFTKQWISNNKISIINYYLILILFFIISLFLLINIKDYKAILIELEFQAIIIYIISKNKQNSLYSIKNGIKYFLLTSLSGLYFLIGWNFLYEIGSLFILISFQFFSYNTFFSNILIKNTTETSNIDNFELIELDDFSILAQFSSYCRCESANVKKDSIIDEVLFYSDSKPFNKINYDEYNSISCEFCKNHLKNFNVIDEKNMEQKQNFLLERKNNSTVRTLKKESCWHCETYTSNLKKSINEEKNKIKLINLKIINELFQNLSVEKYLLNFNDVSQYLNNRNTQIDRITINRVINETFTQTCNQAYSERRYDPICTHIKDRYKKIFLENDLNTESILPIKIAQTCSTPKSNEYKICQELKKFIIVDNNNFKTDITLLDQTITKKNEIEDNGSAVILILISFFFKLAAAPFHLGSLDIYEGSPTSSTVFFVVATKFSIITILIKICYYGFYDFLKTYLYECILIASVASVFFGSGAALSERKLKTLLAYSSISNIGYILLTISIGTLNSIKTTLFYLIIYISSSLATWSGLISIQIEKNRYMRKQNKEFADLAMLKKTNPMLTILLLIGLFSAAGLPPFVGFLTKMNIFLESIQAGLFSCSLIIILLSMLPAFYYLRLVKITSFEQTLIGKLCKNIKIKQSSVNNIFGLLLQYQFFKPSHPILFSFKVVAC